MGLACAVRMKKIRAGQGAGPPGGCWCGSAGGEGEGEASKRGTSDRCQDLSELRSKMSVSRCQSRHHNQTQRKEQLALAKEGEVPSAGRARGKSFLEGRLDRARR